MNANDTMGNNFQVDGVAIDNIANSGSAERLWFTPESGFEPGCAP